MRRPRPPKTRVYVAQLPPAPRRGVAHSTASKRDDVLMNVFLGVVLFLGAAGFVLSVVGFLVR